MQRDDILTRLVDAGLVEASGSTEVSTTSRFEEGVADAAAALDDRDPDRRLEWLRDRAGDEVGRLLADVASVDPEFVGAYTVVHDALPSLSHEECVQVSVVVSQFAGSTPRSDGAPDGFLPVHGDRLPALFRLYPRAIVYVWREDCPPCDVVRADFEAVFDSPPSDVALFAVYGPDYAAFLDDEYDVTGGPTVLFVEDGGVVTRLLGARAREALEREIERLRADD